jgi:glycosyltransferase involved in cell wall biosynthesis
MDGVAFEDPLRRGIQRYYLEMLRLLPDDLSVTLFFNQPCTVMLPQGVDVVNRTEMFPVSRRNLLARTRRKMKHLFHPTLLPRASIFHSTYFTRSPVPNLPEVVTVHDMVVECMPYRFGAEVHVETYVARKRRCILNAAAIIAISEATRDDLIRIYPEVSGRITVIHHGADHLQVSEIGTKRDENEDHYVLFVGDRSGYKNFETIAAAVAGRDWPRQVNLKVVGGGFLESERRMLRYHGIESKIIHTGYVTDSELKQLYQGASAFVFPSLWEGFGFPLLEAQHMGVPVLASDIPVFREIGGNGVIFVNTRDPDAIIRGIIRILEPSERERLVLLGYENIRRFTWEKCAQKTAEVFRAVAQGSPA